MTEDNEDMILAAIFLFIIWFVASLHLPFSLLRIIYILEAGLSGVNL